MIIDEIDHNVAQWPKAIIRPAILWMQDAAGNWNGSDRGAAQDVYESQVVFVNTETLINQLQVDLETARDTVSLTGFTAPIFSPEVDHTGSIAASVVAMGPRRHRAFGVPSASSQMLELPVTFRAISPSLLGTTPSLSTLRLQEGYDGDASFEIGKAFTYNQSGVYADHKSDIGVFKGRFRQKVEEVRAILAYLLVTARANAFTLPTLGGVTYPFGVNRGTGPFQAKIKSIGITRSNFVFYDLDLEFVESV